MSLLAELRRKSLRMASTWKLAVQVARIRNSSSYPWNSARFAKALCLEDSAETAPFRTQVTTPGMRTAMAMETQDLTPALEWAQLSKVLSPIRTTVISVSSLAC
jgi:hypothetical protein